jgi:hypothetical protein
MASAVKRQANRANAHLSTGPKTPEGKIRASKNAQKHGLSIPIAADPLLSRQLVLLVAELGKHGRGAESSELLISFVEAQLDVNRARRTQYELIAQTLKDPTFEPQRSLIHRRRLLHLLSKRPSTATEEDLHNVARQQLEGTAKYAAIISEFGKTLATLDRYERRALSRRKFAVRALDESGFQWPRTLNGALLKLLTAEVLGC